MKQQLEFALRPANRVDDPEDADWVVGIGREDLALTQWEVDRLRDKLRAAKPPHARTGMDIMWDNLDHCYAALQYRLAGNSALAGSSHATATLDELRGECRGLATQLAVLSHPRTLDDIRRECHERWLGNSPKLDRTKTKREMRAAR